MPRPGSFRAGENPELGVGEMTIAFDGRPVAYAFGELDHIVLAYATTIHKSQGSEFPAVVIPVTTQHYMMLQRNLLYTGVTRGKRLVILLGQRRFRRRSRGNLVMPAALSAWKPAARRIIGHENSRRWGTFLRFVNGVNGLVHGV
jgi:ATP-dependent exoDNAse (exonuclease V) alpha subunit